MSTIKEQVIKNCWMIFVTNDDRDILSSSGKIWEYYSLQCAKPCWAIDYCEDMTKLKQPRQYFKEIKNPSMNQRNFIDFIENKLGIPIR
jgi:hypothetical protein